MELKKIKIKILLSDFLQTLESLVLFWGVVSKTVSTCVTNFKGKWMLMPPPHLLLLSILGGRWFFMKETLFEWPCSVERVWKAIQQTVPPFSCRLYLCFWCCFWFLSCSGFNTGIQFSVLFIPMVAICRSFSLWSLWLDWNGEVALLIWVWIKLFDWL